MTTKSNNILTTFNRVTGVKARLDVHGNLLIPARSAGLLLKLVDGSAEAERRSAIALKAVATRKANAEMAARSRAANKAWETRRKNAK